MKIIGHAGAAGLAPANTLASIRKAVEHHADEVEIDVRVSGDGVPVVHHDAAVHDASGAALSIAGHSFAELQVHAPALSSLSEVFAAFPGVFFSLDIKPGVSVAAIVPVVQRHLKTGGPVSVGSFSQKVLREFHAALPDVEMVVIEKWSGVRARFRCRQLGTKRLSMRSWWLWPGFLAGMQRGGYLQTPYTMNDPAQVKRWSRYLYGIVTDYPDRFESRERKIARKG